MTAIPEHIIPATTREGALVAPDRISKSRDFWFRHGGLNDYHKADLASIITSSGAPLDPVLLWRPVGATDDAPLILLDGWHRLAAYRAAKWTGPIPATILTGDRRGALLAALGGNAKYVLPMTGDERLDAAWRLVREPVEPRFKVREVAAFSGVGKRTVDILRKRLVTMKAAQMVPSGSWWQDRRDTTDWKGDPEDNFTDAELTEATDKLAKDIRDLLDWRKHPERRTLLLIDEAVNSALWRALGSQRMGRLLQHTGYADEDVNEWLEFLTDRDGGDDRGDDEEDEPEPQF